VCYTDANWLKWQKEINRILILLQNVIIARQVGHFAFIIADGERSPVASSRVSSEGGPMKNL
jgi:hypothetical protein